MAGSERERSNEERDFVECVHGDDSEQEENVEDDEEK